jgi:hypothetical protein
MPDLFDYPNTPGFQNTDTSRDAAKDMVPFAPMLKDLVLSALRERAPMTSYELARYLRRPYHSIQPRTSELSRSGEIFDYGLRRTNPETRKKAIVWAATPVSPKEGPQE